ncbi:MAG TPA: VOC family protein [Iamia sp.]|nr:VOC family protein [Iamia sp.]
MTSADDGAERTAMHPVVHFEISGPDPEALQSFYADIFGWEYGLGDAATEEVSAPGQYGFVDGGATGGINGGVGGGDGHPPRVLFYVGVPDVEAALARAEQAGGTRRMGPAVAAARDLAVGWFADPQGNLVGVAGPAPQDDPA